MKIMAQNNLSVTSQQTEQGIALMLGGVTLKTPAGNALIVPTAALADALVAEWRDAGQGIGQGGKINKQLLRLTPIACVAIDIASASREAMLADILPYIDTDLVCYRAGDIPELSGQQGDALDPLITWIRERFAIRLVTTTGLMPVRQEPGNQEKLGAVLAGFSPWKLAAFAVAAKPLGSVVLALALVEGKLKAEDAYNFAHLEEQYETLKWGMDDEKEQALRAKKQDIDAVARFLRLL